MNIIKKQFPLDQFGNIVIKSQKKFEHCYFCKIPILGNSWFMLIERNNTQLSVPICSKCSEEQTKDIIKKI